MKHSFICALLLSTLAFSAVATQRVSYSSPSDPGVINQERILYWLEKRGQLAANASEAEKLIAYNKYLGKKSFEPKALPGSFGKKMMYEQQTNFASYNSLEAASIKMKGKAHVKAHTFGNEITNVNVLALLIEFPDHEADKNTYTLDHYTSILFDKVDVNNLDADIASASQYYYLESGGTFNFNGKVNDWPNAPRESATREL